MTRLASVLVSVLVIAGCIDVRWREQIRCGDGACPGSFVCCRGRCVRSCAAVDAGPADALDAMADAVVDAPDATADEGSDAADATAGDGGDNLDATAGADGGSATTPMVISIDFVGAGVPMGAAEMAGVRRVPNWNAALGTMGSIPNLLSATGESTATVLSWNVPTGLGLPERMPGAGAIGYPDVPGGLRMMNGYVSATMANNPASVTVAQLPASVIAGGYDVYVYVSASVPANETWTYQYALGPPATPLSVVQSGPTSTSVFPGFTPAANGGMGNYVVFRNLTAASFTLTANPMGGGLLSHQGAPINGLQVVSPPVR